MRRTTTAPSGPPEPIGPLRRRPILEGARVIVRLGAPDDAPAMAAFYRENKEHFRPTDPPRAPDFYTEAYWFERLAASELEYDGDRACHLIALDRAAPSVVVGFANLSAIVRGAFHACYLGYGIGAAHEGKGLMAEALRLAIDHAFTGMRLHRIMANHLPENDRSARLLRRLGFVEEGYARDYLFINGAFRDHVLTALTNPLWERTVPPSVRFR